MYFYFCVVNYICYCIFVLWCYSAPQGFFGDLLVGVSQISRLKMNACVKVNYSICYICLVHGGFDGLGQKFLT